MPQTFAKVEQSLSQAIQKESVTRDIRQRGRLIRTVGPILSTLMLFLRALFAFLALPTIVGGVVPWLILRNDHSRVTGTPLGWPLVLFGASVLLCVSAGLKGSQFGRFRASHSVRSLAVGHTTTMAAA